MMFDTKSVSKLPVAFQTILAFVLICYGVMMALNAQLYSDGDIRLLMLFLSVGVLFIVAGAPTFIEGAMIMSRNTKEGNTAEEPAAGKEG